MCGHDTHKTQSRYAYSLIKFRTISLCEIYASLEEEKSVAVVVVVRWAFCSFTAALSLDDNTQSLRVQTECTVSSTLLIIIIIVVVAHIVRMQTVSLPSSLSITVVATNSHTHTHTYSASAQFPS